MSFKAIAFVAVGVVLGFAIGGVPARRELSAMRAENEALRKKAEENERPSLLEALMPRVRGSEPRAELPAPASLSVDARAAAPGPNTPASEPDAVPTGRGDVAVIGKSPDAVAVARNAMGSERSAPAERVTDDSVDRDDAEQGEGRTRAERRAERSRGLLERFDQLVLAQRARTASARSALIERAALDPEQLERVDASVQRMNEKLAGYGEEVIAQAASEEPPSPSQALGLGHDVSGILYEGQKELDAVVAESVDEKSGEVDPSALEIWSYVDLEQWQPYVKAQLEQNAAQKSAPAEASAK